MNTKPDAVGDVESITDPTTQGQEYARIAMDNARAYLMSLPFDQQCQWLGGFVGHVMGCAGAVLGGETAELLGRSVEAMVRDIAQERSQ